MISPEFYERYILPFDRRIAAAYSKGEILVDVIPEWKDRFLGLHHKIEKLIG
jgi:hypothetical protein